MCRENRSRESIGKVTPERGLVRQAVEGRAFIEATEMDGPFDDWTLSVKAVACIVERDGDNAEVQARRVGSIDDDLGFAGGMALFKCREVHEGKMDRAFDLVDIWAGKKNGSAMSIDARDGFAQTMCPRILKESKNIGLICSHGLVHWINASCSYGLILIPGRRAGEA
jgi:hypothetical protein